MLTVEVGGSSIQAIRFTGSGSEGTFVSLHEYRHEPWLLAAPGLVEGDRVRGAHHLGWMDVHASEQLGMPSPPLLSMNDAEASGLGEWVLFERPAHTMLYIVMGTGVGAVTVSDGVVLPAEFGHLAAFGPKRCGGCGRLGCLDAQIGGHALPNPLQDRDIDTIVTILTDAIAKQNLTFEQIVLGGGIPRRYPRIVTGLNDRVDSAVHLSRAPARFKSAAPFGVFRAWETRSGCGQ